MKRRSVDVLFKKVCVSAVAMSFVTMGFATQAAAHGSYEVAPGDTLSEIARDHDVSTKALMVENEITNPNRIRVGQVLSIPHSDAPAADAPAPAPEPTAAPAPAPGVAYTVVKGDTLGKIARNAGLSLSQVAEMNDLKPPYVIRIGQVLDLGSGAAKYPNLPQRLIENPERLQLIASFERWAAHYEVSPQLAMTVAYQESGWQTNLTSSAGAYGVGQIMPATGVWLANDVIGIPSLSREIPDDNIRMTVRYLQWLEAYLGTQDLAIAGYYQGPGATSSGKMYDETKAYVAAVKAQLGRFERS